MQRQELQVKLKEIPYIYGEFVFEGEFVLTVPISKTRLLKNWRLVDRIVDGQHHGQPVKVVIFVIRP